MTDTVKESLRLKSSMAVWCKMHIIYKAVVVSPYCDEYTEIVSASVYKLLQVNEAKEWIHNRSFCGGFQASRK